MFLNVFLQNRNQVKGSNLDASVLHLHLAGRLAVLADDHSGGKAVSIHIFIIAHIVLRHDKGLLAFGKEDGLSGHLRSVFHVSQFSHIMETDKDISLFIHGIKDL